MVLTPSTVALSLGRVMRRATLGGMSEVVKEFDAYLRDERMLSAATREQYVGAVEKFEAFLRREGADDEAHLEAVTKAQLTVFVRAEAGSEDGPSRAVWNSRLAALRSFFDYLFRQERIAANPALRLDRQKVHGRERLPLSFEELLALVELARRDSPPRDRSRNVALLQVFIHSGLRVAEVVSLDLDQVDFEGRLLLNVRTKGDKRLSVPFNDVVAEALERYLRDRGAILRGAPEQALFVSGQRRRLSVRSVQEFVRRYAQRAGIMRPVSPHVLRHSTATELADLTSIRVVQEHLGHASVTTTEKYIHPKGGERRRAVDELGARWQRAARRRQPPVTEPRSTAGPA